MSAWQILHNMNAGIRLATFQFLEFFSRNEGLQLRLYIQEVSSHKLTGGAFCDLFLLGVNCSSYGMSLPLSSKKTATLSKPSSDTMRC